MLNLLLLLVRRLRVGMRIHPEGMTCSNIGRLLVLSDPHVSHIGRVLVLNDPLVSNLGRLLVLDHPLTRDRMV